jgi:hypothetical protein
MLGHMIGPMRPKTANSRQQAVSGMAGIKQHREKIRETITTHDALSRRGLWGMLIFIVISGLALQFRAIDLFANLPDNVRCIIGAPPPPSLIHLVLGVSTVSSIIITMGRMAEEENPAGNWSRFWASLAFRSVFYLFYATANALEENFLLVFTAGIIVLVMEHFATWLYAVKTIDREKEHLAQLH